MGYHKLSELSKKNINESSKWNVRWHAVKCYFARHEWRHHKEVKICNWCPERRKQWRDDRGGYLPLTTKGLWVVRVYQRGEDDEIIFSNKVMYLGTSKRDMIYTVWRQMVRWGAPKITIEWTPH